MIKTTPEYIEQLKRQGIKVIEITLEDLAKAKPIYKQKDGKYI